MATATSETGSLEDTRTKTPEPPRPAEQVHVFEPYRYALPKLGPYFRDVWARRQFATHMASSTLKGQHFDSFFGPAGPTTSARADANHDAATDTTFHRPEILGAAENTFGKGAAGLAGIIERTLKDQGEPNAYISGREGSGAVVVGLRYGAGTLFHKVEGPMPVHWTGPSVGFDVGGDASKVFVLVYNLYDSEELFRRFPAGEGKLYVIGGFTASYLRRGNIVLIPIRLGVGWRQGVNLGYMKFSHKGRIIPF